jgi:2'-5' RNA ligase
LRVIDVTPDGGLARLAARMEQAARGQPPPVARSRACDSGPGAAQRVAPTRAASSADVGAFVANRVVLFSSEPDRGGSRYRELASYPLDAGAR